jgi:hypothetical protein
MPNLTLGVTGGWLGITDIIGHESGGTQACDCPRIKIRTHSIRRRPGSATAGPQLASCCFGDFLAANSTGTKPPAGEVGLRLLIQCRFFRWRSRVLKFKPRLWQNSLRRKPLLETQPPVAEPPLACVALALTTRFCGNPDTWTQTPPVEQACWSDVYGDLAGDGAYLHWLDTTSGAQPSRPGQMASATG